jgi:protein-S-isoprenylcysteine O-methyltransferase Ste14
MTERPVLPRRLDTRRRLDAARLAQGNNSSAAGCTPMSGPEPFGASPARKAGISRRLAFVLAPFLLLVAHGVVPWAISLLGPWYGWTDGNPAVWNLLGLVPAVAGLLGLLWLTVHGYGQFARVPERVELNWDPKLLMTSGPYACSRHPMYLTELSLWLGWAVLYGSIIVLAGFVALCVVVRILAPREERALEAKFGERYRRYRARVPRWLGILRGESDFGRTNG